MEIETRDIVLPLNPLQSIHTSSSSAEHVADFIKPFLTEWRTCPQDDTSYLYPIMILSLKLFGRCCLVYLSLHIGSISLVSKLI